MILKPMLSVQPTLLLHAVSGQLDIAACISNGLAPLDSSLCQAFSNSSLHLSMSNCCDVFLASKSILL